MKGIKKLIGLTITISVWILFVNSSETMEWYVEFYSDSNTIHKCPRDKYLEYKEQLEVVEPDKRLDLAFYYAWEPDYQKIFINLK